MLRLASALKGFKYSALLVVGVLAIAPVQGEDTATPERSSNAEASGSTLEGAVDKQIDVELLSGTSYENATLLRVVTNSAGTPERLRVRLQNGRSRTIRLTAVRTVKLEGSELYRSVDDASGKPKTKKQRKAEEEAKQKAAEHEQWLGRLTARGIEAWGDIADEEHAAAIAAHKKRYDEVANLFSGMYMIESQHYLFCSNISQEQAKAYIDYLDEMYQWMRVAYGLEENTPVWSGKAAIYVFVTKDQFLQFEKQVMGITDDSGRQGFCQYDHQRHVTIACHVGPDPIYLAALLVHETSHGFIYCYKTPVLLPSWVDEGMAESIALLLVTRDKGMQRKIDNFVKELQNSPEPRLGEKFFVLGENIESRYYGGAAGMVQFMMKADQKKFVRFIDLLKEGMPWEEALQASYKATKEELVSAYGRSINIPNLRL